MKIRMMMNDAETIVGEEGIPMIVPLTPLMKRLKCTLSTNQSGNLQIEHPKMGILPVDSSSGAPLLSKEVCQRLIKELEEETRKRKETGEDEPEKEEQPDEFVEDTILFHNKLREQLIREEPDNEENQTEEEKLVNMLRDLKKGEEQLLE